MLFSQASSGGQIEMIHVNVPSHTYQTIQKGRPQHYWKPWRAYSKRMNDKEP